jgi:hypothetical protein
MTSTLTGTGSGPGTSPAHRHGDRSAPIDRTGSRTAATVPPHASIPAPGEQDTAAGGGRLALIRCGAAAEAAGAWPEAVWDVVVDGSYEALDALLAEARVGMRFLVTGPEAEVYAVRARLREAGAIDEEISLLVTDRSRIRVYCAHCQHTHLHEARVNETVFCPGCRRRLIVHYHFSRQRAAYLGYMVDAEVGDGAAGDTDAAENRPRHAVAAGPADAPAGTAGPPGTPR